MQYVKMLLCFLEIQKSRNGSTDDGDGAPITRRGWGTGKNSTRRRGWGRGWGFFLVTGMGMVHHSPTGNVPVAIPNWDFIDG